MKILMFFLFIQSLFAAWEINDVSYLYPLPKLSEKDFLLRGSSIGSKGPLYLEDSKHDLMNLVIEFGSPKNIAELFRVVAMRVDPCFKYEVNSKCSKQIRLIWQPKKIEENKYSTYDASMHSFYDLSSNEFKNLLFDLLSLKAKYRVNTYKQPLNIHPGMKKSKVFIYELSNIILKYAGVQNLKRLTFMSMLTKDMWWSFTGMDKQTDGSWVKFKVPRTDRYKQDFFNDEFHDPIGMLGAMTPELKASSDNLTTYLYGSLKQEQITQSLKIISNLENTSKHAPHSTDCVSCHIAEPLKIWIKKSYPREFKKNRSFSSYFKDFFSRHNRYNKLMDKESNKSLRMFGYINDKPSVAQRVINESVDVANLLNSL